LTQRGFPVALTCGLPATAQAISGNATVVPAEGFGYVVLFPGDAAPSASTINYRPGQVRANNVAIGVTPTGSLSIGCGAQSGRVDVIVDVNGYFE
jgi:hypothetical protein